MSDQIVNKAADNIRILSAAMVEKAKSGHPGGAMGGADFINVLLSEYMVFDPDDMTWANRDRFFLDPGHMSPMLYSALSFVGKYSMDDLKNFRQWGSVTPGHPELDVEWKEEWKILPGPLVRAIPWLWVPQSRKDSWLPDLANGCLIIFLPSYPMEESRKKSLRGQVVLLAFLDFIT